GMSGMASGLAMRALLGLVLLGLLAAPVAVACTAAPGPVYQVDAVVTEGDRIVLVLPTGNSYSESSCGPPQRGDLQFDGRYLAWTSPTGFQVYDVNLTWEPQGVLPGVLVAGHTLSSDGLRLRVHDIAAATDNWTDAPTGSRFVVGSEGVAYATAPGSAPDPRVWLRDALVESWLLDGTRFGGAGWPGGNYSLIAADRDWVAFLATDAGVPSLWAFRVSTQTLHGPLPLDPPTGTGTGGSGSTGGAATTATGIFGDRLYLFKETGGWGGYYSDISWSIQLPGGTDAKSGGPAIGTIWGRTAFLRDVARTETSSVSMSPTTTTHDEHDDWFGASPTTTHPAAGGLALVAGAVAAAAVMRRRLPS
ncbi:MAG: hypothetical protein LC620_08630, partial [Halobacteriales archaeon]|nr:hypothetical protein [Halobacteriales archaeon]